jgi:hypothetical protein
MSVINPKSGRSIKIGTKAYKKLLTTFDNVGNVLVPKNKTNYAYSSVKKYWIPISKLPKSYIVDHNKVKFTKAFSPNGRQISLNSPAFNKYVRLGYHYNQAKHSFENVSSKTIAVDDDFVKFSENLHFSGFVKLVDSITGETKESMIRSTANLINLIFNFSYDHENPLTLTMYDSKPEITHGPLFDGDVNCFISIIQNHLQKNPRLLERLNPMIEEYEDGVFAEDIEHICDRLNICIYVHTVLDVYKYGKPTRNKTELHIDINKNHAILRSRVTHPKQEIIYVEQEIPLYERDDIFAEYSESKSIVQYLNEEVADQIQLIRLNEAKQVIGYASDTKIVKFNSIDGYELEDNEFTVFDKACNEIKKSFSRPIQTAKFWVPFSGAIQFSKEITGMRKMIDIKGAYNHFPNELPADIKQIVDTTARLDVPHAFYMIRYECAIEKRTVLKVWSQEVLDEFDSHGVPYVIYKAYVSTYTTQINIDNIVEKYPTRTWHKFLGKIQRYEKSKISYTDHPEEAMKYGGIPIPNTELFAIETESDFNPNGYYPHIAFAVMHHTVACIYKTVLEQKIDAERVWVDSIVGNYTSVPDNYSEKKKEYSYAGKSNTLQADFVCEQFLSENNKHTLAESTPLLRFPTSRIHIVYGQAGTGKSSMIKKILQSIPSSIVLAPTNLVCSMYERAFTIDYWLANPQLHSKYDTILLDEFSMVDSTRFEHLTDFIHPTYRFLAFGDTRQLPPVNGTMIDVERYSNQELKTVYRQQDTEFVDELQKVFIYGKHLQLQSIDVMTAIKSNYRFVCCVNSQVDMINKIAYEASTEEVITNNLKKNMVAFVDTNKYKKLGICRNELCTIVDATHIDVCGTVYDIAAKSCKPAVAITCHKLQGQTIDCGLVVDITDINKFDRDAQRRMLYTMYTRVRERGQLYSIQTSEQMCQPPVDDDSDDDAEITDLLIMC